MSNTLLPDFHPVLSTVKVLIDLAVRPGVADRLDMAEPGLGLGLGGALESEVTLTLEFAFKVRGVSALSRLF